MKLPKTYEPAKYESDIYALWEKSGAFQPSTNRGATPFSTIMPPPNANAGLHVGHATFMYPDIIARYRRLKGDSVLYLPGADHAGFETWVVYEKKLAEEGKTRFDFSREELYKQVWDFVQTNRATFDSQFRRLGLSTDWTRFTFTLDDKVVKTAYDVFKRLWDDKLIYRGERIVNFCTHHGTSFSDIEVTYVEEMGKLWHIAYPLTDGSGELVVASTRPETKLGQAALMVNPDDERYKKYIGKEVNQPLVPNTPIKVIADDFVDETFGTGVVTVTPAHDANDFEVAQRHKLPIVELITHEGKMSENVPEAFRGMTVLEARDAVALALDKAGFIRKVEDYTHKVGKCYKCGTVIEPLIRDQWFVSMKPLAEQAIKALEAGDISFYPKTKKTAALNYLKGIKDWNISRQIAWGIPIPAFQNVDDPEDWIFNEQVAQETIKIDGKTYRRDPDVFDTWFSSGQWPFVTTGYPDSADFKKFYPNTLMEVGTDLLYQWVCRMVMLGLYVTKQVPFKTVYMHGMVIDDQGKKLSKSKGNALGVMDALNTYGADAVRMGLVQGQTAGANQQFIATKMLSGRNFANKLWNMARFVEEKLGDSAIDSFEPQSIADHWVLSKLQHSEEAISKALDGYRIGEAYDELYHLVWDDIADWYLEASKVASNPGVLKFVLESILKLAHPFAPFVTETIWQTIHGNDESNLLISSEWPKIDHKIDKDSVEQFEQFRVIVSEVRFISTALQVTKPSLYFKAAPFLTANAEMLTKLGRLGKVQEVEAGKGMHLTQTSLDAWLDIDNRSAHSYLRKLDDAKDEKTASIARLEARLSNKSYVKNAPDKVVDETKAQLETERELLDKLKTEIATFQNLAQ